MLTIRLQKAKNEVRRARGKGAHLFKKKQTTFTMSMDSEETRGRPRSFFHSFGSRVVYSKNTLLEVPRLQQHLTTIHRKFGNPSISKNFGCHMTVRTSVRQAPSLEK